MRAVFVDEHPVLGAIPGPAAVAVRGDDIWLVGGGRGESAILHFGQGRWRSSPASAHGLRAVLPLDEHSALVCGERGYLAIARATQEAAIATDLRGCLYSLARYPDGTYWVSGDEGLARVALPDGRIVERVPSGVGRMLRVVVSPVSEVLAASSSGLMRVERASRELLLRTNAPVNDLAFASDGTVAVCGDHGQLWIGANAAALRRCDAAPGLDLEAIAYDARLDAFRVVGDQGWRGVLRRDGTIETLSTAEPRYRLTSLALYRDEVLYAGWVQHGPPYRMRGALYSDGARLTDQVLEHPD